MIYFVSKNIELFTNDIYNCIDVAESLHILDKCKILQFDTETSGLDPHINKLKTIQLGNKKNQIVIDVTTIDIMIYKNILESTFLIGHNLKFDLQFLYNYNIIPRKVYDTMIVEQFIHLGYPAGIISYSLKNVLYRYLSITMDKSIRETIATRDIDSSFIIYAARDVEYLEDIMYKQLEILYTRENSKIGAKIECDFIPVLAYLEWCGIKLDENKWKIKMAKDKENLIAKKAILDSFIIENNFMEYIYHDSQGSLFEGFNISPKCNINWDSSKQVIPLCKKLGFNTTVIDKKTGKYKDSILEKHLISQIGINAEFIKKYLDYKEYAKLCSTYGQGHLNLINPITNRLHTNYNAIGTVTGRMSSGGGENKEIAILKKIKAEDCKNVNMQQLPADHETRSCFVAEEGNLFCSCDYSAMEAREMAEICNEKLLLDEFLIGSGDTHAAYAKVVFSKELEGIDVKDIARLRPDLRKKVKSVEFASMFGSDGTAVAPTLGISVEEARQLVNNLLDGMQGFAQFKKEGAKKVVQNGYVEILKATGHRAYWWDWEKWKQRQLDFKTKDWNKYKELKAKNKFHPEVLEVKHHFQAKAAWERAALNSPSQGGGAVVTKVAATNLFNWIIDNGYFNKILIVNITHDEINSEFPKDLDIYPTIVQTIMKDAAALFFHKLPIPAVAEVELYWKH